jgi:hypothetical protein
MEKRIRIKARHPSDSAPGGYLYEIEPIEYEGPAELKENTVLEVVGQIEEDCEK